MKNRNSMLYLAIMNLFIVFLGVGLVIPVMPMLQESMHLSGTTMGLLVSVFAISQLIASPIAGNISDKLGRKKLIAIGMFVFAVSELIFGLGHTVSWLYFSRALGGIAVALIMPSVTAYVADVTTIEERPKSMGLVSAAISGGFIIGPGLGGFIAHFGMRVPFFVAAALGLIGCILAVIVLKEPEKKLVHGQVVVKGSFMEVLKNPVFTFPFVVILISSFGLQSFESIYSIMAVINFGFTTTEIAMIITVSGSLALFFQIVFFDKLINLLGEVGLIRISFFVSAIFVGVIAFTNQNWVVILSTFIVFLAFDLQRPAITTYLSKRAGDMQGTVNGLNSTFTSVGNIFGPMVAGSLFDMNHFYPYYVSSLILLVTSFLSLLWKKDVVVTEKGSVAKF
ncbi:multidrug efflux MFS transporter EmeA [Enterococcus faecium]|uniref:MFS transporter n=1 Tax=Enterococcus faecium TaxID=1352 RepID=UPI002181F33B|nr:MFS transporter [Enterococcus faecium]BDR32142.1 multidrug resistance protein [Enterococcus faecium]GLD82946.1 multidrug resistance protein [Enterococcus faecium]GMR74243.1 multidrug efflux MFS transporter EmeA [Enterococcus faecium]GMR77203.1 multidrug efflux MFS transporter EmeA [Enterococcus faecium]GMR85917.1 multidrug efflux MFS transporter EmeA [Enterococcus faecium]